MNLPDTLLLEIFSYIPLPQRFLTSNVCRSWYRVCHDSYLYRHVEFINLEYKTLVLCLQKLVNISPRIKSLRINGCYSTFIQNTVVSVHFSSNNSHHPALFSHISALQPQRRREEYMKHNFELHDQFSDCIYQLFCSKNGKTLNSITIENCTLDLEMTELFCIIASHCHELEALTYNNNHDKGIHSSGLLQSIVTSSPHMKHFRGLHSGMNDAVLLTIARHWTSLESLTLFSSKSRQFFGPVDIISDGHQLIGSSPTGRISSHSLWKILCKCQKLDTLELFDLACLSNRDLSLFESMKKKSINDEPTPKRNSRNRYSPYYIPPRSIYSNTTTITAANNIPGYSIRNLIITKYMTTPLSKPGFESLLNLFPQLNYLKYETNFHTFNNLFEGVTREMFYAECNAIQDWYHQRREQLIYDENWNARITTEQRLMAGMASVSEGHP